MSCILVMYSSSSLSTYFRSTAGTTVSVIDFQLLLSCAVRAHSLPLNFLTSSRNLVIGLISYFDVSLLSSHTVTLVVRQLSLLRITL